MSKIQILDDKITRIQFSAKGFKHTFFLVYKSVYGSAKREHDFKDWDIMAVLGSASCFSIELYLKFLAVIASFNTISHSGYHFRGHCLDELYINLKEIDSNYTDELETLFSHSKYNEGQGLFDFLKSIREQFLDWRYVYDSGNLTVNLNTLSDLLNILEKYSSEKYIPISKHIRLGSSVEQSMFIDNFDDVKEDIV